MHKPHHFLTAAKPLMADDNEVRFDAGTSGATDDWDKNDDGFWGDVWPTRPTPTQKGRGTMAQPLHRFSRVGRDAFDDGWAEAEDVQRRMGGASEAEPESDTKTDTHVRMEQVKSVLVANDSPDIDFDLAINPYRGCEHGCIYCYARPTHSYLNLSPGLDFETRIIAKQNVAAVLRQELGRPSYRARHINIGSATDCYQPVERSLRLTRSVIEVLSECQHAFTIITKSSRVERDIDLIAPMAQQGLAAVYITIATLDAELCRVLEPRAASPLRRLRTIETLVKAGIPVGVSVAPQIPFLNTDMELVLKAAHAVGASRAFYTVLRLPWELDSLFQDWLSTHFPLRAQRVMARVRDMRGGKNYDSDFKSRMKGSGLWAELVAQRFEKTCHKLGLNRERQPLDLSQFNPDALGGQGRLF
jgi:DNA repair photolyase